jgi:hypothetical protein
VKIRRSAFKKMPAVRVSLQLVWRIEMLQPLCRVERIMFAMNLDDAQAAHFRSKIRQTKGCFASRPNSHQIRHRDAISSPLPWRDDQKTNQLRLTREAVAAATACSAPVE